MNIRSRCILANWLGLIIFIGQPIVLATAPERPTALWWACISIMVLCVTGLMDRHEILKRLGAQE